MSEWQPKRFWTSAAAVAADGGFLVELDGRPVKTPAKAPLLLPTKALAEAIAQEWDAQQEKVDPLKMPLTRGANAAIDKVGPQRAEVIEMLAAYGDSDLLCYRASAPVALVSRQAKAWDPLLDWAADQFGARLFVAEGVMHVEQPPDSLAALHRALVAYSNFGLAGAHDLIAISGSLVLGLAVMNGHLSAREAWPLSRIDEDWQIEQWGEDEEATVTAVSKRESFIQAERFFRLVSG